MPRVRPICRSKITRAVLVTGAFGAVTLMCELDNSYFDRLTTDTVPILRSSCHLFTCADVRGDEPNKITATEHPDVVIRLAASHDATPEN